MGNGAFLGDGDGEHVLLRVIDALLDGHRHFLGLAQADAHATVAVADDDKRGERKARAALDDLAHAIDVNDALLELRNGSVFLLFASHTLNPF